MRTNLLLGILLLTTILIAQEQSVTETVHNLSVSGRGKISAADETEICIFCHIAHKGSPDAPLWNRTSTRTMFEVYPDSRNVAEQTNREQPQGASRICLSCHDGTISLRPRIAEGKDIKLLNVGPGGVLPEGRSKLGTILSDDHPVSIPLNPDFNNIRGNHTIEKGKLVPVDRVECTSCHDPHNNQYDNFLVKSNTYSELCLDCHFFSDWQESSHGNSYEPRNQKMLEMGCSACHSVHAAPVADNLLVDWEEELCFRCHDGNKNDETEVATKENLMAEFNKPSRHPIDINPNVHYDKEGPYLSYPQPQVYLPEIDVNARRHVECVDCHNPHSVRSADLAVQIAGSLNNVWGINLDGQKIDQAVTEQQICYKCHSSSKNLPANQTNKMQEFDISNPSFHPVEGPGVNMNVPSLMLPLTTQSTIKCTDCHNTDDTNSIRGPHGSSYYPILELNYTTSDHTYENEFEYALCYKCHDRNSILHNRSFPLHSMHIVYEQTSCYVCHDSHGSQYNSHLINFDTNVVTAAESGQLEFIDYGERTGVCYLMCHGENHDPREYR